MERPDRTDLPTAIIGAHVCSFPFELISATGDLVDPSGPAIKGIHEEATCSES